MKNRELKLPLFAGAAVTLAFSAAAFCINKLCGALCLAAGLALICIFCVFTKKRYDRIRRLNDYLSLVCSGNYDFDIADNSEGELSILKNNLYKVVVLLRTSNEALKKDKLYLADSLADISHQLKTPLTSMTVITDLIKTEQDREKQAEFARIIENQLGRMNWLVATLLKLSKLDAGTVQFAARPVEVRELVDESLKPFLLTLDLKNISVRKDIADFTFTGDRNWCIEALQNIIKNCIEHTEENGLIEIETAATTLYSQIVIKDNGCGIPEADLGHIFERFRRGSNSKPDSVGIGLALSKAILQKHNAALSAENIETGGSAFTIKFYKSIV